jgi:hypothetical protein
MSAIGPKQTWHVALHESAFDPKRTFLSWWAPRLLGYAIRLLGARMAQARTAGIGALVLFVAASAAFAQTELAVSRHQDRGGGIGVALGGGCLRFRQSHRSFRSKSKVRRHYH